MKLAPVGPDIAASGCYVSGTYVIWHKRVTERDTNDVFDSRASQEQSNKAAER